MRIAIIPARGGSRRIPRKNIRPFFGKPIIAHSILTAHLSGLFEQIYVSTEDEEIAQIGIEHGAMWHKRDARYAQDGVGTQEVTTIALAEIILQNCKARTAMVTEACCIYPCAPLVYPQDLATGLRKLMLNPNNTFSYAVGGDPLRDAGQWYWGRATAFLDRRPLDIRAPEVMLTWTPPEKFCDINTEADWDEAVKKYAALIKQKEAK